MAKKAATKKPKPSPSPQTGGGKKEKPEQIPHVVCQLRGTSRHWPNKIGSFIETEPGRWILEGRAIPMDEWNERAESIADTLKRDYDMLLSPLILVVMQERQPQPQTEKPAWQRNLEKARPHNEQSRPQKPASPGTLY